MPNSKIDIFETEFAEGKWDSEYAEYIMEHAPGDRVICDGDGLVVAMEDLYLADDFIKYMTK